MRKGRSPVNGWCPDTQIFSTNQHSAFNSRSGRGSIICQAGSFPRQYGERAAPAYNEGLGALLHRGPKAEAPVRGSGARAKPLEAESFVLSTTEREANLRSGALDFSKQI